jgi:3-isopropylmalate/(R)-2-methylmalate dehydratase large subunit
MPKTIAEKIFSLKSGKNAYAGDIVIAQVDAIMTNDASGPLTIDFFNKMCANSVHRPESVVAIIDHYVPCPNRKVANLQQSLFNFATKYGITVVPAGEGIAHQVFDEMKFVQPGTLIIGGDSHTTTQGYLNCIATGVGASDLAVAMNTGELWFKVPETIYVEFSGELAYGITGKDVALYMLKILKNVSTNYKSIEFGGSGISSLTINDRRTICNLIAECSAKCGIMPFDDIILEYCIKNAIPYSEHIKADINCSYSQIINIDLSTISFQVSLPHNAANSVDIDELVGKAVDMVVIGTCTNGRIEDFQTVYEIITKSSKAFAVETLIIPASRSIYRAMVDLGIADALLSKGAMILPPGCGPCCGSSPGIPSDNATVLSTANRNFIGRMGNVSANIYLSSPSVAAASALTGRITSPKELIEND